MNLASALFDPNIWISKANFAFSRKKSKTQNLRKQILQIANTQFL